MLDKSKVFDHYQKRKWIVENFQKAAFPIIDIYKGRNPMNNTWCGYTYF